MAGCFGFLVDRFFGALRGAGAFAFFFRIVGAFAFFFWIVGAFAFFFWIVGAFAFFFWSACLLGNTCCLNRRSLLFL